MDALTEAGLGLDHDELRLERTTEAWVSAGTSLRDRVAATLEGTGAGVEQIGSSSVPGLLAKPIVDIAVGLVEPHDLDGVGDRLRSDGWIYRGDAGENGGHVFVLETHPWHRVAHLHVVEHEGDQWRNYLRLRDLLHRSAEARDRYEASKVELLQRCGNDREAYTEGKTQVVRALLAGVTSLHDCKDQP